MLSGNITLIGTIANNNDVYLIFINNNNMLAYFRRKFDDSIKDFKWEKEFKEIKEVGQKLIHKDCVWLIHDAKKIVF